MIPFQERRKVRSIIYSKATLGILLVVLVLVGRGAWNVHQKASIARSEYEEAKRSLSDLEARRGELQASIEHLESKRGMEAEIRQKFSVARQGEELVVLVDETSKKGENANVQEGQTFWGMIKGIFSGN